MDLSKFEEFNQKCLKELPDTINQILKQEKGKKPCAIGFITTDDFYGFSLSWDYSNNIEEYYNWEHGLEPDFLYQPVTDVVESCTGIDFCCPSDEKWNFAMELLTVLEKNIKQIPNEVFINNNYNREDILFFATMGDGDYIQEMLDTSIKMFNNLKTVDAYRI